MEDFTLDPYLLWVWIKAVDRIRQAIERGELILKVYGDYDADGRLRLRFVKEFGTIKVPECLVSLNAQLQMLVSTNIFIETPGVSLIDGGQW